MHSVQTAIAQNKMHFAFNRVLAVKNMKSLKSYVEPQDTTNSIQKKTFATLIIKKKIS